MLARLSAKAVPNHCYAYDLCVFAQNGSLLTGPVRIPTAVLYDWLLISGRKQKALLLDEGFLAIDIVCCTLHELELLDGRLFPYNLDSVA